MTTLNKILFLGLHIFYSYTTCNIIFNMSFSYFPLKISWTIFSWNMFPFICFKSTDDLWYAEETQILVLYFSLNYDLTECRTAFVFLTLNWCLGHHNSAINGFELNRKKSKHSCSSYITTELSHFLYIFYMILSIYVYKIPIHNLWYF